ncbi:MAG: hypothetical protein MAG451_01687 [Anaerolineales bacterium]|nr:hypothetical protein [Anaerolineales bacterium]
MHREKMRAFVAQTYVLLIRAWLRWGKPVRSKVAGWFQPKVAFEVGDIAAFDSLSAFAGWLEQHTNWRADPVRGLFDLYPSLGHLFWQLENDGIVEDDCDGLSYFSAACVAPYCDSPADRYLVDIVLDPFEIEVSRSAHSICIFRRDAKWRVISNGVLDAGEWDTFDAAVRGNSYARDYTVLWWEVRDVNLKRVSSPRP